MSEDAQSIDDWCRSNGLGSRSSFYALQARGLAPRSFVVGGRRLISREAAADWRRQNEERTAAEDLKARDPAPNRYRRALALNANTID